MIPYSFDSGILATNYYAVVTDGAGQEVTTSTVTVSESNNVDFGVSITGASPCNAFNNGYGAVTGLTGTAPYTFQWSNGGTTQIVNNLPPGNGSVVVTDSNGCSKLETFNVGTIAELEISSVNGTQPDCFQCNGTLTFTASGGTPPYTFSASTGAIQTTNPFTISNLCGGSYTVDVQDSGNCQINYGASLTSTAGFTVVSVQAVNSDCGENGEITVNTQGVTGVLTYSITGDSGYDETVTSSSQSHTFDSLESDTYTIEVTSSTGCVYSTTKTILNEDKFTIGTTTTGTTCGTANGSVEVTVSEGSTSIQFPLSYTIKNANSGNIVFSNIQTIDTVVTVENLASGP